MDRTRESAQPAPTLPAGTQVVTRAPSRDGASLRSAGAVGVIVGVPFGTEVRYRVRFPDGEEALLARRDLTVRKDRPREGLRAAGVTSDDASLDAYVILRCVVGSRAYGLERPGSDTDRRGIYLPPADLHDLLVRLRLQDAHRQEPIP